MSFYVIGGYSVVAWFLLGLTIYKSDAKTSQSYQTNALLAYNHSLNNGKHRYIRLAKPIKRTDRLNKAAIEISY